MPSLTPSLFDNPQRARVIDARARPGQGAARSLGRPPTRRNPARRRARRWPGTRPTRNSLAMASEETATLDAELARLDREIQLALLPPDPNEDRDAIVEIRAGTGGSEAALFAADLHRMYTRYVENIGLRIEPMDSSPSELGGLKEVVFRVSGQPPFSANCATRAASTACSACQPPRRRGASILPRRPWPCLPEAEEVELELKPDELRIEVCRAGGPGAARGSTRRTAPCRCSTSPRGPSCAARTDAARSRTRSAP